MTVDQLKPSRILRGQIFSEPTQVIEVSAAGTFVCAASGHPEPHS
jgi:hypothetical protein